MTNAKKEELVLVTGGTGFVGIHCILQLLQAGYTVRTTIRSLARKLEVLEMLRNGNVDPSDNLHFIEADLTKDDNWAEAVKDCDYLSAYLRSKTLAEKAAWDFIASQANANAGNPNAGGANTGTTMELSVINPVGIFGPLLGADLSTGHEIIKRLLDGSMKATPKIPFGIVDVRDVADLHLRAMVNPKANGQRFLALAGEIMWLPGIALLLKNKMGDKGQKVTTKTLPDWLVRVVALFNPMAKKIVPQLGRIKNASNEKARVLLGWSPRTNEEAILSAAESLFRFGVVKTAS